MSTSPTNLATLNGTNGTTLLTNFTSSTSSIGDINGDKIADFLITLSPSSSAPGNVGQAYVLFGTPTYPATTQFNPATLNGSNGFTINVPKTQITDSNFSISFPEQAAVSSPGDVNGDGIDDLVISYSPTTAQVPGSGVTSTPAATQVVFGRKSGFASTLDLASLNGTNGFTVTGGYFYSSGDVNNDGVVDMLLSNPIASPNNQAQAGQVYAIYGNRTGFSATLDVNAINGTNGLVLNGAFANAELGRSDFASSGDFNGDGISDIGIFGGNSTPGNQNPTYIVYGFNGPVTGLSITTPTVNASGVTAPVAIDLSRNTLNIDFAGSPLSRNLPTGFLNIGGSAFNDDLTGSAANNLLVGNAGDDTIDGLAGDDVLIGGTGTDLLIGGDGKDQFGFSIGQAFNATLMGVDSINDFSVRDDKIQIDRATFTRVRRVSFESVENLGQARRSNALIVYNEKSGALLYNENGARGGFGSGGQFAVMEPGLAMAARNFTVVG